MFKYIRFSAMALLYSPLMIFLLLNGSHLALLLPLSVIVLQVILDNILPKYTDKPDYKNAWFLDLLLYIQIPLSYLALFILMWQIAPGDLFGFGQWVELTFPMSIMDAHNAFTFEDGVLSAMACGFYFSVNTLIGHELTHRLNKPFSMFCGKASLVLVGDLQFAISHVYAHHKNVATPLDAATARRGESLYAFFIRSTLGQYREAWEFECLRLTRKGKNPFFISNQVISGILMSVSILFAFYFFSGLEGAICYAVFVFVAKFLFESINYIEHYGLVRVPGEKVEPRHSWDCQNSLSTFNYLNLTRHSDHHANARKPYWELETKATAVDLPLGYMTFLLISTIPPLWHALIIPKLLEWDESFANPQEKELAYKANQSSGLAKLVNSHVIYSDALEG